LLFLSYCLVFEYISYYTVFVFYYFFSAFCCHFFVVVSIFLFVILFRMQIYSLMPWRQREGFVFACFSMSPPLCRHLALVVLSLFFLVFFFYFCTCPLLFCVSEVSIVWSNTYCRCPSFFSFFLSIFYLCFCVCFVSLVLYSIRVRLASLSCGAKKVLFEREIQ